MCCAHISSSEATFFSNASAGKPTLPAKLIHFVMNHLFDTAPVSHPGVVIEGLEGFAWAVGFRIGFSILAVGGGAGVAALRVLPGGERAVRPTFLHFHGGLLTVFSIKCRSQILFRSSAPVREEHMWKLGLMDAKRPWERGWVLNVLAPSSLKDLDYLMVDNTYSVHTHTHPDTHSSNPPWD